MFTRQSTLARNTGKVLLGVTLFAAGMVNHAGRTPANTRTTAKAMQSKPYCIPNPGISWLPSPPFCRIKPPPPPKGGGEI